MSLVVIPAVILFRFLPHLYFESGALMLLLAAAGYAAPWLLSHRHGEGHHPIVVPALAAHAALDGAMILLALSASRTIEETLLLTGALLLHRIPEGLFVVAMHDGNVRRALPRLAIVGLAMTAGVLGGDYLLGWVPRRLLDGLIAFGMGMMLHVLWKQGRALIMRKRLAHAQVARALAALPTLDAPSKTTNAEKSSL